MTEKKLGRPTSYKPEYCKDILKFFDVEYIVKTEKEIKNVDGTITYKEVERPNKLPTFERFAVDIGVCVDTLHEWKKVHPDFSEAYKKAQHLQKDMLMYLAMIGMYNPYFTQFVAKNITDMKDKTEQDLNHKGSGLKITVINKED